MSVLFVKYDRASDTGQVHLLWHIAQTADQFAVVAEEVRDDSPVLASVAKSHGLRETDDRPGVSDGLVGPGTSEDN